jgi:hypothetical protein
MSGKLTMNRHLSGPNGPAKPMKSIVLFAVLALAASPCCTSDSSTRATPQATDSAFITDFLNAWLVRHDLNVARQHVSSRFFMTEPYTDPGQWPSTLQNLPMSERALRLPFECTNPLPTCNGLDDCIESPAKVPGRFDMQSATVGQRAVDETPELEPWRGQELVHVSFKLNGCNIATIVLLEKHGTSRARVISMSYFAG